MPSLKQIVKVEEHDQIFSHILKIKKKFIFINIDAHSDLAMCKTDSDINIGNFLSKLIYENYLSDIIWIKNKKSSEFDCGSHNFYVGKNLNNEELKCTEKNIIYFADDSYETIDKIKNPKKVNLLVILDMNNFEAKNKSKEWVLSIDYDFFSSSNPYKTELKKVEELLINKKDLIEYFEVKSRKIDTFEKWKDFQKEIFFHFPKDLIYKYANYNQIEFLLSEEEIINKIFEINNFIQKNFLKEKCLKIFFCKSMSSGYTNKQRFKFIEDSLYKYLNI